MNEKKLNILLSCAMLLLVLSAALPLVLIFSGQTVAAAPELAAEQTAPVPLAALGDADAEMRGLWIATVNNINFPSRQGMSASALAAELDGIVDFAAENGFNAIFFQVRPAADALYRSSLFPASKFISGKAGEAPDGDFDCLGHLTRAAHEKQIAVHAWVNPLRVTTGSAAYPQTDRTALPADSYAATHPDAVVAYADGKLYFNAGLPEIRQLVADGVREICENYAVDGIIFDDYFYPYPVDGAVFDDDAAYTAYGADCADRADFRRDSINKLVRACYDAVKETDQDIRFGVSPFGIWKNGDGENGGSATRGLSAYDAIYCDALAWVEGGYVDYLAPQLYWSFDTASARYDTLCEWWNRALDASGVDLYINHGAYRYAEGAMESGELTRQTEYARDLYAYRGSLYYGYTALRDNAGGVTDEVKALFSKAISYPDYTDDGSLPTLAAVQDGAHVTDASLTLVGASNPAYAVSINGITPYRKKDGSFTLTLSLRDGDNLITVQNGAAKLELIVTKD